VTGGDNSLAQNIATRNGTHGFALTSASSTDLDGNLAISNGGQGIDVTGSNNTITRNHAVNNALSGIQFTGMGTGNEFETNVAMQSTNNDVRDTTACAGATWTDNSFGSSNDPCIQ
jgi:parallel beta-helix repeat protein